MALPYYLPPSVPFGTGVPGTSVEQVNQIYQRHNIQTMAFLRGMQYPPPHIGYNFTPIPFKPYYTAPVNSFLKPPNSLDSLPFSHTVPNMIYPVAPVPLQPMPFAISTHSYQSQLKQVVKRVAASNNSVKTQTKKLKTERKTSSAKGDKSAPENNRPIDLIVIPDDDHPTPSKDPMPLSGSRMNPLFVGHPTTASFGNDLSASVNQDHSYGQQLLTKPGPGQQYITKIRTLVEGIPVGDQKLSPSTKEKKVRQKSKTKEDLSSPNNKKRKTSETTEAESKIVPIPSNWHPDPESYAKDHLVIGSNGTFISKSFYNTIPWRSYNKSTKFLIGHYFNNYTLGTQSLDGENPLNMAIIEDIISHVMEKCNVGRDAVRNIISSICAHEARKRQI